jgi:hypothetical protein
MDRANLVYGSFRFSDYSIISRNTYTYRHILINYYPILVVTPSIEDFPSDTHRCSIYIIDFSACVTRHCPNKLHNTISASLSIISWRTCSKLFVTFKVCSSNLYYVGVIAHDFGITIMSVALATDVSMTLRDMLSTTNQPVTYLHQRL